MEALRAYSGGLCCCGFYIGAAGLSIALLALWIWMIVEVATKEPAQDPDRLMWLLIVILLGWIGAAVYYFVRRPTRIRLYGR